MHKDKIATRFYPFLSSFPFLNHRIGFGYNILEVKEVHLNQNVGPLDRATRIIMGILLVAARYFFQVGGLIGIMMVGLSLITLFEGMLGYCFLYGLFGWSTKRRSRRPA